MGDYMNLLNLKCESCGASIDVTKDTNVFECSYCGTTNVLDADQVTVNQYYNSGELDFEREYNLRVNNGFYLMHELHNYEKAYDVFCEVYETSKYDTRLLEGLMESCSHGFDYTKVLDFWLMFESEYTKYLEVYSKLQKDPIKVAEYESKLKYMKDKAMGNHNSTKVIIFAFMILVIIGLMIMIGL